MQLDRALETCWKRHGTDIVFAPDNPPLLRTPKGWHAMSIPPLDAAQIRALADERMSPKPDGEEGVYAWKDFRYGDVASFRAIAFGYPNTTLLVISCPHIHYQPPEE